MILSIGEILADMVDNIQIETLTYKSFCSDESFNKAVKIKQ